MCVQKSAANLACKARSFSRCERQEAGVPARSDRHTVAGNTMMALQT
jgi:hypothetical protein